MEGPNQNLAIVAGAEDQLAPGMNADTTGGLQRELSKWRERVPRLVAALRERTDEVAGLRRELQALQPLQALQSLQASQIEQDARHPGHAGARARDDLIGELERELAAVRGAHEQLQGELHARHLSIANLKRDLAGWKYKWQGLASAFDPMVPPATAGDIAALEQALAAAAAERDDLRARNADLFETTTRANRQMETLADDLAELREQLKAARAGQAQAACACDEAIAALDATRAERDAVRSERDAALAERDAGISACDDLARARLDADILIETLQQELQVVLAPSLAAARSAAQQAAEMRSLADGMAVLRVDRDVLAAALVEQQARVEQLAVAQADRERTEAAAQAESQRLQNLLRQYQVRQAQLEQQLGERSALVVSLEQDQNALDLERRALEASRAELEESDARARRHAQEHAERILQLDDRVERQKALLLELEQELAGAQEAAAVAERRRSTEAAGKEAALRALELQVAALQGMLAEQDGARATGTESPSAVEVAERRQPGANDRDGQTLLVLSQQLRDARTRNQALLDRLREFEARAPAAAPDQAVDDLTQIHGVGPRLAQHLGELGVSSFRQIAELDPQSLDDPAHVLAGLKSRIVRDRWIEQAVCLDGH
jgi:predicted flap endonuclease-1-like 5' DNA nuclease